VQDAEDHSDSGTSDDDYDPQNCSNGEADNDTLNGYEHLKATAMSASDIADVKQKLGIDEASILQHFKKMNIYHHVQRVPKSAGDVTSSKSGTHHTASYVNSSRRCCDV
jgi:hypothetical protein